jgi:hypothetical protein
MEECYDDKKYTRIHMMQLPSLRHFACGLLPGSAIGKSCIVDPYKQSLWIINDDCIVRIHNGGHTPFYKLPAHCVGKVKRLLVTWHGTALIYVYDGSVYTTTEWSHMTWLDESTLVSTLAARLPLTFRHDTKRFPCTYQDAGISHDGIIYAWTPHVQQLELDPPVIHQATISISGGKVYKMNMPNITLSSIVVSSSNDHYMIYNGNTNGVAKLNLSTGRYDAIWTWTSRAAHYNLCSAIYHHNNKDYIFIGHINGIIQLELKAGTFHASHSDNRFTYYKRFVVSCHTKKVQ